MIRRAYQLAIFLLVSLSLILLYYRTGSKWKPPTFTLLSNIDTTSLFLTEEQCSAAFPGLFVEVENAEKAGSFHLERLPDKTRGLVHGRIKDGKLYIISTREDNGLKRTPATLNALHRAIITSPVPLPDTVFALNINDIPNPEHWDFARPDDTSAGRSPWLMPHYSFWSWPTPNLGPLDQALSKIERVEEDYSFQDKIDKVVWRGTKWLNPDWRMALRPMLLEVAHGREWADVEEWGLGVEQNNSIPAEGFCKYKYIIYTEGKTYSGRLPYHLACESIILTPPPTYLMHNTHLLRPVFSSLLPLNTASWAHPSSHPDIPTAPPPESYPIPNTATGWPLSYPPEEANVVFIHPDWADLEDTIIYLRANPTIAAGIARRQRELWVGKGMLSEAAEVCYWRRLIRGWAEKLQIDEDQWQEEGMRWETYSLLGKFTYD